MGFKIKMFEIFSSYDDVMIEVAEDNQTKRVIVKYPLVKVGANKKGFYATEELLKKSVPLFQGIPFRYDIQGKEGSSHITDKLSSPHFDVGWTYKDQRGAWYDPIRKSLYVKGEVTHPEVVEKLLRITTDGKSELNFASMGVKVDRDKCINTITNRNWNPDEGYKRNGLYGGQKCYIAPSELQRAYHVALTNDPAETEAELEEVIAADMQTEQTTQDTQSDYPAQPNVQMQQQAQQAQQQIDPEVFKTLVERVKALEQNNGGTQPQQINGGTQQMMTNPGMAEQQPAAAGAAPAAPAQDKNSMIMSTLQTMGKCLQQLQSALAPTAEMADQHSTSPIPKDATPPPDEEKEVGPHSSSKKPSTPAGDSAGNTINKAAMDKPGETEQGTSSISAKHKGAGQMEAADMSNMGHQMMQDNVSMNMPLPNAAATIPVINRQTYNEQADIYKKKYKNRMINELAQHKVRLGRFKDPKQALQATFNEMADQSVEQVECINMVLSEMPSPQVQSTENHFADQYSEFGMPTTETEATQTNEQVMTADQRAEQYGDYGKYDVIFNPQNAKFHADRKLMDDKVRDRPAPEEQKQSTVAMNM